MLTAGLTKAHHNSGDLAFMDAAIVEAQQAPAHGDVPVGAVVVLGGEVIASRHNEREKTKNPTAHAELLAIQDAAQVLGTWRLLSTTIYCTLEPCAMCASALQQARIERLVFGAADLKAGACGSLYNLACDPRLNHEFKTLAGVRAEACAELLTNFFKTHRTKPTHTH